MKTSDKPILVTQGFDASVEDVWNAITQVEQMAKWYISNITSFEPKVGHETRFVVQNQGRTFPHLWQVTKVVPPKIIAYNWSYEGYPGSAVVTFQLFESDNQTELRLTFTVIKDFSDSIPEFKRESAVTGWRYFIEDSLKQYLDGQQIT